MRTHHTVLTLNRKEPIFLAIGDLVLFGIALWLGLAIRYQEIPTESLLQIHLVPFSIVFLLSLVSFYVTGLYSRAIHTTKTALPGLILNAQIANGVIAIMLFYFIPQFSITPKTNLFIYLGLSTLLVLGWRISTYPLFSLRRRMPAIVIGDSAEVHELIEEMNHNLRIGLVCRERVDIATVSNELIRSLEKGENEFQYIIADLDDSRVHAVLPELYQKFFGKISVIDLNDLYEDVFDRVPLSRMNHAWIMTQISIGSSHLYDLVKRLIDIVVGIVVGIAAIIVYPFVALAIKIEDGGSIFVCQDRIGKNGEIIRIHKFRSMQGSDFDKWVAENSKTNRVTKVGRFIRKTRIDELPQALAILKGDMSLIGPRADIIGLGERLQNEIPYYSVRTSIPQGLIGWAQINQKKPPQTVEETKLRLSYDLYYITHRSLGLDIQILLRTFKTLLARVGM